MALQQMLRMLRLSMVRLPSVGYGTIPKTPIYAYRDLWKGDSIYGIHLVKGELIYKDEVVSLQPGLWGKKGLSTEVLCKMYDFSWLRDMRELGTDNARLSARALVADWIGRDINSLDPVSCYPYILGSRLTNWLGHYDFFAASADDAFRHQFMQRFLLAGRYLMALLPLDYKDYHVFSLLKGVLCLTLCLPDQFDTVKKVNRYMQKALDFQILDDGMHIERNSEIQLDILKDLVEIRLMYKSLGARPPNELIHALDNVSRALRALRHADGGLALFNGANENKASFIDYVLLHATQKRIAKTEMIQGGYVRCYTNRATLIVDTGDPTKIVSAFKYSGALSFEFSAGKQRIFVNCGSGNNAVWKKLLSGTAAHTVLSIENTDSVTFKNNQQENSHFQVTSQYKKIEGSHLLELSHNGWLQQWGTMYYRTLYLAKGGWDLRGEERIEAKGPVSFLLRFHLHPSIKVEEEIVEQAGKFETIYTLMANSKLEGRQIWIFRFDGAKSRIEESVYFGQGTRIPSKQIVLYGILSSLSIVDQPLVEKKKDDIHTNKVHNDYEVTTNQPEGNSDYVAIFHHQDSVHSMPQEDCKTESQENGSKMSEKSTSVDPSNVENPISSGEFQQPVKQIVRWALHRKL